MKIRVISEFYDKYHTSTLFKVGTVLDFDDERANDVIAKKLAEPYVESEEKKRPGRPPKTEEQKSSAKAEQKPAPKEAPKADAEEAPKAEVKADAEEAPKATAEEKAE